MNETELRTIILDLYQQLAERYYYDLRRNPSTDVEIQQLCASIAYHEKMLFDQRYLSTPGPNDLLCPVCRNPYPYGSRFCGKCGCNIMDFYTEHNRQCVQCHSLLNQVQRFCGICGASNPL